MRRVLVLAEVAEDLEAARDFCEGIAPAFGMHFIESLLADIGSLSVSHGILTSHFGCHRKPPTYFPFGIYYVETETETTIVGLLDLRREPGWSRKEISHAGK